MKKDQKVWFTSWFCDWFKTKAIDNVLDDTSESFEDMLYRFLNEAETDGVGDTYNLGKFLYELFKEQW